MQLIILLVNNHKGHRKYKEILWKKTGQMSEIRGAVYQNALKTLNSLQYLTIYCSVIVP